MTFSMRRLSALVLATLLLAVAIPVLSGAYASPASATAVPSFESRLLVLTNADRARAGLAPLRSSAVLVSIARSWASSQAATRRLAHNPALASQVTGWSMLGENVAMAWSSDQAEQLFMASADHRANILQPRYDWVGIGVAQASDGSYWFTVDFEQTAGYAPPVGGVPPPRAAPRRPAGASSAWRAAAAGRASRSARRTAVPRKAAALRARSAGSTVAAAAQASAADRFAWVDARAEGVQAAPAPGSALPTGGEGVLPVLLVCGGLALAALGSVLLGLRRATGG